MSPQRIQRKRTKGWKMPKDAVYVGRQSGLNGWGNPYIVGDLFNGGNMTRQDATDNFRAALLDGRLQFGIQAVRRELAGKNLACWCRLDQPCHADVLLEIANGDTA